MSDQTVEKCVLIVGKCGAGKSTIANQLAGYDPLSNENPPFEPSVTRNVSHTESIITRGNVRYKVTVIDTVGLFDTMAVGHDDVFDKIKEYFKNHLHIKGVNVILFVFRKGRVTEEEKMVFSLIESRLTKELLPISALAITGCENLDDEAREGLVNEFEGHQDTKRIAGQMRKGIYPVGFPSVETLKPILREAYKPQMMKDRDTLLDLVFQAEEFYSTQQLFLKKESRWSRWCNLF